MNFSKLKTKDLPTFPGWLKALGPGIIWLALAQGSGEIIWWPYMIAKYGLAFLFLLIPACLLQYPLNYEIGRYTLLTGESIFQGFIRFNKSFAFFLFILMVMSFLWFGAFASAGGTALAALTHLPAGWSEKSQTLLWAYGSIIVFFIAITFSKVIYNLIEKIMWLVAIFTFIGLFMACLNPEVIKALPEFFKGLFYPAWPEGRIWDPKDTTTLLTAITFAGLGGFWTLFYSYWLKEKGIGMAKHMGNIEGLQGHDTHLQLTGYQINDTPMNKKEWKNWKKFLLIDSATGIFGNILTTLMTCLLSYAILYPKGIFPNQYQIAVVQSQFFETIWGIAGKIIFLLIAAAFLSDTWLTTIDAISRIYTDCIYNFFPKSHKYSIRQWYFVFIIILTLITSITMPLAQPGVLIQLSAVIGFIGTVCFTGMLLFLNHKLIPQISPSFAQPKIFSKIVISISWLAYLMLAGAYLYQIFFH